MANFSERRKGMPMDDYMSLSWTRVYGIRGMGLFSAHAPYGVSGISNPLLIAFDTFIYNYTRQSGRLYLINFSQYTQKYT